MSKPKSSGEICKHMTIALSKSVKIKFHHIWNGQPNGFTCKLEDYFYTKRLVALGRWASVLIHHILDEQLYFQMHVESDHLQNENVFLLNFFLVFTVSLCKYHYSFQMKFIYFAKIKNADFVINLEYKMLLSTSIFSPHFILYFPSFYHFQAIKNDCDYI